MVANPCSLLRPLTIKSFRGFFFLEFQLIVKHKEKEKCRNNRERERDSLSWISQKNVLVHLLRGYFFSEDCVTVSLFNTTLQWINVKIPNPRERSIAAHKERE